MKFKSQSNLPEHKISTSSYFTLPGVNCYDDNDDGHSKINLPLVCTFVGIVITIKLSNRVCTYTRFEGSSCCLRMSEWGKEYRTQTQ